MVHHPLQGPAQRTPEAITRIHSYLRRGRITKAQKRALDQHWLTYGLDLNDGTPSGVYHPAVVLEVGFGNGESLLQQAIHEPEKHFIGIEVHLPGIGRLLNKLASEGVANVSLYHADGIDVLNQCIPDFSVDRLQMYFPDPWTKKRHLKRRLVQVPTVPIFLRVIKPGGLWHLATDSLDYAQTVFEAIQQAGGDRCQLIAKVKDGDFSEKPAWRPETKFERSGIEANRPIHDLVIQVSH